ncbi:hypothetical protein MW887_008785 [Aspergillus wentii]|nr:hypothetical protein MW887_008785 [Aspergillus wentii]
MAAYPRPDFQRPALNWTSLNGAWDFIFDDSDQGLSQRWHHEGIPQKKQQIQVPYAFQTPASGIGIHEAHEVLWYERVVEDIRTPDEVARGHQLLLRFGAVDYDCTVWLDGQAVGGHRGGHVPFDLNVTDAFSGNKAGRLTLRVRDSPYDLGQPRGKQYWGPVPESIFYTPTSGIWQSVWVESVPKMRIGGGSEGTVLRSDDIESGQLHARFAVLGRPAGASKGEIEIEASLAGVTVSRNRQELAQEKDWVCLDVDMRVSDAHGSLPVDNGVALWAPEHPTLYDLTLRLYNEEGQLLDEVQTTTGMRNISWTVGDSTFRINGKPRFQTLVLDQGYWPETGLTPPSQEALRLDIELCQKMGVNGCRKHQKVEDPVFYYWADRLGFLVWGEMANAYEFSDDYISRFNSETLDPTRPINDNCGWEHVVTDLTTYHDYTDAPALAATCSDFNTGILGQKGGHDMFVGPTKSDPGTKHAPGAPVICSEMGGVNIIPTKGTAGERDWGYTTATDPEDFLGRLERLVMAVVKGGHSCGLVYTQLCDIEQEVNGLYSYDRQEKVAAARVKGIMDAAHQYYYEHVMPK